jgi:hypothetical protein
VPPAKALGGVQVQLLHDNFYGRVNQLVDAPLLANGR